MHKYLTLLLLLMLSVYSAQQKRLISGKWDIVSIAGLYHKKTTTDNNTFPFVGNKNPSINSMLIDNVIDFNSSNNNIYSLFRNSFDLRNVDKYDSTPFLNSRIDAYRLVDGVWEIYSSKNLSSSSNDFTNFELGKSYWVKATSSNPDNNISIILDNHLDLLSQYALVNRWNIIALNDDVLEHSASAFFIPSTELIFTISRAFNLSPIDIDEANIIDVAKSINHKSFLSKINGEPLHLRAYPASKIDGATNTEGIIVISNSIMNISSPNALSLSGEALQGDISGNKVSNIEHIIGFKLDTTLSTAYQSMLEIKDLDGKSSTINLHNNINTMTNEIVLKTKEVLASNNVIGYNIMVDFNDTTPVYDNILISSSKPFAFSEMFYARKFEYLRDGKFFVVGADAQALNTPSDINRLSNATGIIYHNLGDNKFEISSHYRDDLDLFKNDKNDLFKKIPNDNKGYITKAYKAINLYGAYVKDNNITPSLAFSDNGFIDEIKHTKDLANNPIYSESINRYRNLQKFFLLGKQILTLYSVEYTRNSLFWRTIDFTKKSNWFDKYDKASLFVNNKEFGYYAYLKNATSRAPSISGDSMIETKVSSHFNSKSTYNLVNYRISIKVSNLAIDKRYVAYIVIAGKVIQMYDKDGLFEVMLDSEYLKLEENKKYPIAIKIANNTGALVFNQNLSLEYPKPVIKSAKITNNTLVVESDYDYEVYNERINEINKKETFLGKNITDLSAVAKEINYKNIKVVAVDNNGFYSDIYSLGYIPDNDDSTLRANNDSRNGITLRIVDNLDMSLTFTPVDEDKLIITAVKLMYLKVGFKVIGSVFYDVAHKNNKFFVSYDNKKYEGVFQDNENYDSDANAYELTEIK